MTRSEHFDFADLSRKFLTGGKVNADLFIADGLHPNAAGYMVPGKVLHERIAN